MSVELTVYTGQELGELRDPDRIFFIAAKNSYYLNKPTALGTAILPFYPPDIATLPAKGDMDYTFPPLDKVLMGKVFDFFQRTYTRLHTEAEVLLAWNPNATPDVRVFVPPQRVSHGSVSSAYDPEHLGRGWQLIGSIHSHCDFSAFHSGTDTKDASEFDGLHITIGDVMKDTPSFAAMVTQNNNRYDYNINRVADISELRDHKAPAWWDRYILNDSGNEKIAATYKENDPPPRTAVSQSRFQSVNKPNQATSVVPYRSYSDDSEYFGQHANWDEWASARTNTVQRTIWNHESEEQKKAKNEAAQTWKFNGVLNKFYEIVDELATEYNLYPFDLLSARQLFDPEIHEEIEEFLDALTYGDLYMPKHSDGTKVEVPNTLPTP
jgi:hypothetical protein